MPYAQITCEYCGRPYAPYPVEEVERWLRAHASPAVLADTSHFQRYVRIAEALCRYCRESRLGKPQELSAVACSLCGGRRRDRKGRCRSCGCPPGDIVSHLFANRGGGEGHFIPNKKRTRMPEAPKSPTVDDRDYKPNSLDCVVGGPEEGDHGPADEENDSGDEG